MTIENSFGTLVNDITKQVLVQVQQQVLESINAAYNKFSTRYVSV